MKRIFLLLALMCATFAAAAANTEKTAETADSAVLPSVWARGQGNTNGPANVTGKGVVSRVAGTADYLLTFDSVNLPAGDYVEVDLSLRADSKNSPQHYVLCLMDGDSILPLDTFKVTVEHPVSGEFATSLHTIRLPRAMDTLQLRLKAVEPSTGAIVFAHQNNIGAWVSSLGTAAPRDTLRVLCIGNSFTYVYQAPFMLKQLAWSRRHYIDMHVSVRGGFSFADHLTMEGTQEAIQEGGYDVVFLQNQSQTNALYGRDSTARPDIMQAAEQLVRRIRQYSPKAKIIVESTWSYPADNYGGFGSFEHYDALMEQGSQWIAKRVGARVSYIDRAFARARKTCPDLVIYQEDNKHQTPYGAYLKVCVNYRMIYGVSYPVRPIRYRNNTANPDLWFGTTTARRLRRAVNGGTGSTILEGSWSNGTLKNNYK